MEKLELLRRQTINGDRLNIIVANWKNTAYAKRIPSFAIGIIEDLKQKWNKYDETHHEILLIATANDREHEYFINKVFETAYQSYCEIIGEMNMIIASTVLQRPAADNPVSETCISLPRLNIPKFSGRYEDWRSFYDLFSASVHSKASISPVHKLQMLKSLLEGEAEVLLRHFQITDANYYTAWNSLVERYDNKRVLVNTQLRKLLSQNVASETSDGIKQLLDTTMECVHALEGLSIDLFNWDPILNYIVTQRLPPSTHALWEQSLTSTDIPQFSTFTKFLEKRFRALEFQNTEENFSETVFKKGKAQSYHVTANICWLCKKSSHPLKFCPDFLKYTPKQRSDAVSKRKLCKRCFAYSHRTFECPSSMRCSKCNRDHNTLLHWESNNTNNNTQPSINAQVVSNSSETDNSSQNNSPNPNSTTTSSTENATDPSTSANSTVAHVSHNNQHTFEKILLATALVHANSNSGSQIVLRALLDSGSQVNLITQKAAELLGLKKSHSQIRVSGVGNSEAVQPCSKVCLSIQSRINSSITIQFDALIMPTLTQVLPTQAIEIPTELLNNFQLADPTFGNPSPIDLLLSAETVAEIMLKGMKKLSPSGPMVQNTKLGWVLSGSSASFNRAVCIFSVGQRATDEGSFESIDRSLRSFWELENITKARTLTEEDLKCIKKYDESISRGSDGRFTVSLPFRSLVSLGCSRDAALNRFLQLERRFRRDPDLYQQYSKAIQDYLNLGHMQKVKSIESDHAVQGPDGSIKYKCSYLPHHGVIKESSTTTRLRVVFDASAKSRNGNSLNDCLLTGPVIQDSLMGLLMRWRQYPVVMKADITQMYRQIWISKDDSEFQRILWRSNFDDPIEDYRLTTVTFGVASAPFLAIRTLQHLAQEERHRFPIASRIVQNDFYVDDLLTGADTVVECVQAQNELIDLLRAGGFSIRKWSSNRVEVVENVDIFDREAVNTSTIRSIKALGLKWSPIDDCFSFKNPVSSNCDSTKRTLLSDASKLFDPLGWLAPTVVIAKILFQKLWIAGLEWDDPLPESIQSDWLSFKNKLQFIESIKIPRWIGTQSNCNSSQLHGFCDASEQAYAAAVYLRTERTDGSVNIELIGAKTRVAPVKTISIARLELCGALLLAQLLDSTKNIFPTARLHAWSDSEIVLFWLHGHPNRWKTFVANRVSEIQTLLPPNSWRHVCSSDNPADCASRGIHADLLSVHNLWWKGPKWLSEESATWPKNKVNFSIETTEEKGSASVLFIRSNDFLISFASRHSSLSKLVRVTAFVRRWMLKVVKGESFDEWLSPTEIQNATYFWIRHTQSESFHNEICELTKSKPVHPKSKLRSLNPFIGSDGILRVGGRIGNADLTYSERHPIILPSHSLFTNLVIDQYHLKTLHGGTQLMLANLRSTYWILNARNTIRHKIHSCARCYRYSSRSQSQLMADLPRPRVTECRPFTHTGVDYAGPIDILTQRKPGRRQCTKGYICLFVCFATKAIHLELVGSLSTDSFLAAFNRFCSRRGLPSNMYSDNGTNFVGAAKQLEKEFRRSLNDMRNDAVHHLTNKGVNWKFIPPSSPHFGGLWEAGVKSTKRHLKRILGNSILTYEEMVTVLTEIEGCLNSRPLSPMTNDPSDLSALTPGHFLIGDSILSVPRPSLLDVNVNRLDRFQLLQRLHQNFWQRWRSEYLSRLQQRPKWVSSTPNIKIGDLVLIKDDCSPPSKWPLGRIVLVHPGSDGLVRVATVKTAASVVKRPIAKLCLLPSPES